jgi:WD40 repeat protein
MSSVTPHRSDNDGPRPRLVISTHDCIWRLAYLPDGRRIVTGSGDGNVKVWNLENGEQEGTSMEHESEICDLAVTRDGTKIISSDVEGKIKVWNVESHEIVKEWTDPGGVEIALSPDDRLIAVGDGLWLFTPWKGDRSAIPSRSARVSGPCVSLLTMWQMTTSGCMTLTVARSSLVRYGATTSFDVLWSRDGSRLFSASNDKTIRCWNSDTGEQIGHPWTGHTHCIACSPFPQMDRSLRARPLTTPFDFWDATTGNPIGQHLQHDKQVDVVRFSPSGESVASLAWDGKIYLWQVPWLNSIKHQVRTPFRWTSVFILIALYI